MSTTLYDKMMQERATSGERMLQAIENPIEPKHKLFADVKKSLSAGLSLKKFPTSFKDWGLASFFSLKNVHRLLVMGSIAITFISVGIFIKGHNDFEKRFKNLISVAQPDLTDGEKDTSLPLKLTDTAQTAERKNIFAALLVKSEDAESHPMEQAVTNLKLVGIIWSGNPQAMIEDSAVNKTFLLGVDEMMGDFKIKNIFEDKVILSKGDQQWELK